MIYAVRHTTTYGYDSEVGYARLLLRLEPRNTERQAVLQSNVRVDPAPLSKTSRIDVFENHAASVVIDTPHDELIVESRCLVSVAAPEELLIASDLAWEATREAALATRRLDVDSPAHYLSPTRATPMASALTEFARASFTAGRPVVDAAVELMGRVHRLMAYDPRATDVHTTPLEAFEQERGVCQDFAQIMIAGLRGLGLPARYVSGYLRTVPPPGQERLQGADATHAWIGLWCGEARGWVELDPTNDMLTGDGHIVLAYGRDYRDAAPIGGLLLGPGRQTLKVEVDVVEQPEGRWVA